MLLPIFDVLVQRHTFDVLHDQKDIGSVFEDVNKLENILVPGLPQHSDFVDEVPPPVLVRVQFALLIDLDRDLVTRVRNLLSEFDSGVTAAAKDDIRDFVNRPDVAVGNKSVQRGHVADLHFLLDVRLGVGDRRVARLRSLQSLH